MAEYGVLESQCEQIDKMCIRDRMMAQDREVIDEAYAGDIIGVFDPGIFSCLLYTSRCV